MSASFTSVTIPMPVTFQKRNIEKDISVRGSDSRLKERLRMQVLKIKQLEQDCARQERLVSELNHGHNYQNYWRHNRVKGM